MQELVCHCGRVNTFPINMEKDGNYVIVCKCGHEQCRVCEQGRVTGIRWKSKPMPTFKKKPTKRKYTQQQLGRDSFLGELWLSTTK